MTQPLGSHGTILQQSDMGGTPVFTDIAELVDIGGPNISQAIHDAPSQNIAWMQKVAGIANGGDVSFDINFLMKDATHDPTDGLLSLLGATDPTDFKLIHTDAGGFTASEWAFSAFLSGMTLNNPVDAISQASISLEINGEPVPTAGASS